MKFLTRKGRLTHLLDALSAALRSTTMITLFISCYSYFICCCRFLRSREYKSSYKLCGAFVSPLGLLEDSGKLTELTLFCSAKLYDSLWRYKQDHLHKWIERLIFTAAFGTFAWTWETNSSVFTSVYAKLGEFFLKD